MAATAVLVSASPSMAGFVCVPEIDGGAGVSTLAMLATMGVIAYQRRQSR